ncbi:hypothetical protein GSI_12314 [Ganoderma sinense ZZ0214-1]|uniref:Uncharacterized protein n=1 Tax=Ganoderma sinense ZZ0214-1 TaxID=1077348 RepID=A0A2G8RYG3_9APHY|nr:hypothetical protein GSI_12314 [Ganoderma sinense ZZ0214-1]
MSNEVTTRMQRHLLNSRIAALFLEAILFGILILTYSMGTWSLVRGDPRRAFTRRNLMALGVSSLMFLLSFVHLCLTVQTTAHGFVTNGQSRDSIYTTLYNSNFLGTSVDAGRFYLYPVSALADAAEQIYRLFIVWEGQWVVVIGPALLSVIDAFAGFGSSMSGVGRTVMPLLFFVFSFLTNTTSSALIMWRVLRTYHRDDACEDGDWRTRARINLARYRPVFEAILQSAAVYSTASLVLLITFLTSPNVAYYTSLSIFSPLMGLVFSLIVLRTGRGSSGSDTTHVQLSTQTLWRPSRKGSECAETGLSRRTSLESADLLSGKEKDKPEH